MAVYKSSRPSVQQFRAEVEKAFAENPMVVFLCGPSVKRRTAGAKLRAKLQNLLEKEGFEVVLGEDDGLEALRQEFKGVYAHLNELAFLRKQCGAIVLIADSVGAYCELGLFAYEHTKDERKSRDFILIISDKYAGKTSYLNEGPAKAVRDFGALHYADLKDFDCAPILERLQGRRAVFVVDRRGRPIKR